MKYIVLSFDDGRKDFYQNAMPILKKYNLTATLNIITDYVDGYKGSGFKSGNNDFVSWDEIKDCIENGIEIANHSSDHSNNIDSIKKGVSKLKVELDLNKVGLASPNSEICKKNMDKYLEVLRDREVEYIRSGIQIKRDGIKNAFFYILAMVTKSKKIFSFYNKNNRINLNKKKNAKERFNWIYPSVTFNQQNTIEQLIYFIKNIPDNYASIIMFHSILEEKDLGYGEDKWYNSVKEFEELCKFLSNESDILVITNLELNKIIFD